MATQIETNDLFETNDLPLPRWLGLRSAWFLNLRDRRHEELANALTHGFGLLLSLVGSVVLIQIAQQYGQAWFTIGCGIYAATLVSVYAASTLSHAVTHQQWRPWFRKLDQTAIYLLIVGTYTPFALVHLISDSWWILLTAMWVIALCGASLKMLWAHRVEQVCVIAYVLLGWMPALAAPKMLAVLTPDETFWVLAGGLCYTFGTIFLVLDRRVPYFHVLWHLLVILGSACHYYVIVAYVAPFVG